MPRRSSKQAGSQTPSKRRKTSRNDDKETTRGASDDGALKATAVDLKLRSNRRSHHTSEYEQEELIVRRGQDFTISLTFSDDFNADNHGVVVQLAYGANPKISKETLLRLPVNAAAPSDKDSWYAVRESSYGAYLDIRIASPPDAIVGRYKLLIDVTTSGGDDAVTKRQEFDDTITVLFNPWCTDDDVYMEDYDEKQEYVLNERGRLWMGTYNDFEGCSWNFGQFEDVVLEGALYLLEKAKLSPQQCSDPVQVVRCISAMANSYDDKGVLEGRWEETFPGRCTRPEDWAGSVSIMEQFMATKTTVQYGQCWVFSGLVTSLLRSLGIPTRSVTNFESAHDTDGSTTIDTHVNEDGESREDLDDSIWNFHVWNESWFRRRDLPDGYDGWQAVDATPQETSQGKMRCGPASVKAIKEGNVYLPYDAPFIFAEVNGDRVFWEVKDDKSMKVISKDTESIGQNISTKAVGSNYRRDLTYDYKYKDRKKEREAVRRAFRASSRRKEKVYDIPQPDVKFTLKVPERVPIGEDITIWVNLKNQTDALRNVRVKLTIMRSLYTGVSCEKFASQQFTQKMQKREDKALPLKIKFEEYKKFLKPDSSVKVYMKGVVVETSRSYAQVASFRLAKPGLSLQVPKRVNIGEEFTLHISFMNSLGATITHGEFHIEAPGIARECFPYKKRVRPGEVLKHAVTLTPSRAGSKEINVTFSSGMFTGLQGSTDVQVRYQE